MCRTQIFIIIIIITIIVVVVVVVSLSSRWLQGRQVVQVVQERCTVLRAGSAAAERRSDSGAERCLNPAVDLVHGSMRRRYGHDLADGPVGILLCCWLLEFE